MLELPRIRPLSEEDIDLVIADAGGKRAHEDAATRTEKHADYRLGSAILELKILDEEGLAKPERQQRVAALFRKHEPERPVIVIDSSKLPSSDKYEYIKAMQGPIQGAVRSARRQLKQSRSESPDAVSNILFVINSGFTTLSHEELVDHVSRRVRNDTEEIDGVVIGGCYLYSDGFDTVATWPIKYITIHSERPFPEFSELKSAWDKLAGRHMTDFVQGNHGQDAKKIAQTDLVFEVDNVTYVKPALSWGVQSEYYGSRRPRYNTVTLDQVEAVAFTVPTMTAEEFPRIRSALNEEPLMESFEVWIDHVHKALATSQPLLPVVPVEITRGGWEAWRRRHPDLTGLASLRAATNYQFTVKINGILSKAHEIDQTKNPPKKYVAVVTEFIGQDEHNDVSHITFVTSGVMSPRKIEPIVRNARVPFPRALALAAAHAIKLGTPDVLWHHDLEYAWT